MSLWDVAAARGQAIMRKVYGADVAYTGAGLDGETVSAIRADVPALPASDFGGREAQVSFEIERAALPGEPDKGDLIVEGSGERWSAIDINGDADLDAWIITVEEATAP